MKRTINYFIVAFVLLLSTACEKKLNLLPEANFSEETFFKSAQDFELFANELYMNMPGTSANGTRDAYSDLLAQFGGDNNISDGSYPASPSSYLWAKSYIDIRHASYLIEKIATTEDEAIKAQVQVFDGEARFFRALSYYYLYRDFGDVPLVDKVVSIDDESVLNGPKSPRSEVIALILSDLDAAITELPAQSALAAEDNGRVTKGAALALKARAALFEGTWQKFRGGDGNALLDQAVSASDELIASNEYSLFDRKDVLGDSSYQYFFILDKAKSNDAGLTKADQNEFIFTNRYDANLRQGYYRDQHGYYSPTHKLAEMFLCKDGLPIDKSPMFQGYATVTSEYENRDLRMSNDLTVPFTRFWSSYPPEFSRDFADPTDIGIENPVDFNATTRTGYTIQKFLPEIMPPTSTDYPIIRLAEVLLINAEARYERNGAITDAELDNTINKLRDRVGTAHLTNAFASNNGLDLRTEIRRERTVELFLEGFRFDDLRRWKIAETEMPMPLKGIKFTGTEYSTDPRWSSQGFTVDSDGFIIIQPASKRSFTDKHYLMPIPTNQIQTNPALVQNPGW